MQHTPADILRALSTRLRSLIASTIRVYSWDVGQDFRRVGKGRPEKSNSTWSIQEVDMINTAYSREGGWRLW